MHAAGMRFEPHSYDHPDMRNRGYQFIVFQILAPRRPSRRGPASLSILRLSLRALRPVRHRRVAFRPLLGGCAHRAGATQTTDDLFALRRIRIQGSDDLDMFILKLTSIGSRLDRGSIPRSRQRA